MLNGRGQVAHDYFLEKVEEKKNCFLNSENRNIGKTTTINELGLTLQALGYRVFILTPCSGLEYYAEKRFSLNTKDYYCSFGKEKCVVLADEPKLKEMDTLLEYCRQRNVPVVGYVNYEGMF